MEEPSRISSVDIAWSMSGNDLDVTYKALRSDVDNRCRIIDKGLRVRIQAWIAKLDEEVRRSLLRSWLHESNRFSCFNKPVKQTTQLRSRQMASFGNETVIHTPSCFKIS